MSYFGEITMTANKKSARRKSMRGFMAHLMMGLLTNLLIAPPLVGIYFLEDPRHKLVAGIGVLLACELLVMITRRLGRVWKSMKPLGYYFLLTTGLFWLLDQRRHRLNAEARTARLRELIAAWPDLSLSIVTGIIDPEQQERTLTVLLNEMGAMRDSRLATLTDRFRHYLPDILKSIRDNGNYALFGQVMTRLSSYGPGKYRRTYKRFLCLLSDAFDASLPGSFDRQFQKHMKGPLQNAIEHAGQAYAGYIQRIAGEIMADDEDNHEIANSVAGMLVQLDWNEKRDICHVIFNESLKRAFRLPKHFGIDFLNMLSKLEHRIFWLDVESLRKVLEESLNQPAAGLINLNRGVYGQLCSKVLAPLDLENLECDRARKARVFRRLKGNDGKVRIECILPDGGICRCEGESLSLRGVYSKECRRDVGEKLTMNIIPVQEAQRRIAVRASVAPLHAYEAGSQGPGRGAFFEEAEPPAVRELYEYVSTRE